MTLFQVCEDYPLFADRDINRVYWDSKEEMQHVKWYNNHKEDYQTFIPMKVLDMLPNTSDIIEAESRFETYPDLSVMLGFHIGLVNDDEEFTIQENDFVFDSYGSCIKPAEFSNQKTKSQG